MQDLTNFNDSINLLIYGDSGVGKTVLAGGAPDAVFISTEKGTIAAKRAGSKAKLIQATSWEMLEAALDFIEANPGKFKWAILDSLTKMQVLLIRYILKKINEDNDSRDLDIPAIQDHQKWQNMFKRFVDRIIDMDINVIFTATAMHKEDAEGEDLVLPDIQGKDYAISQYVCAQMDGVYALVVKMKKNGERARNLLAQNTPPYFAKDRYDALGDWVTLGEKDPENMIRIIELIEESAEYDAIKKGNKPARRAKAAALDDELDDDEDGHSYDDVDDQGDLDAEDGSEEDDDDDDSADDEDADAGDDEDEPEEPPKARSARTQRAARKPPAQRRRAQPRAVKPVAEDDDEGEEEEEAPRASANRGRTARRPAGTARQATRRTPSARAAKAKVRAKTEVDDEFDPDTEDEIDFDEE